jgi:hypothetical protein
MGIVAMNAEQAEFVGSTWRDYKKADHPAGLETRTFVKKVYRYSRKNSCGICNNLHDVPITKC